MAYVEPPRDVSDYDPRKHGARCDLCPLAGNNYVPFEAPKAGGKPKLIVVGEGPGYKEEIRRKPFCLVPETLVLMSDLRWKPLGEVRVGDEIITLDEEAGHGHAGASRRSARRWRTAIVTARHDSVREVWQVKTSIGDLYGTGDHRVLAYRQHAVGNKVWRRIDKLIAGRERQSWIVSVGEPWARSEAYAAAWLAGFLDGEGHVLGSKSVRSHGAGRIGFSQNVGPTWERANQYVRDLSFELRAREKRPVYAASGNSCWVAHIAGGLDDMMRFLGTVRPERLVADFQRILRRPHDQLPFSRDLPAAKVISRTRAGTRPVIDITTTAGTFIANGLVVHNCGVSGAMLDDMLDEVGESRWDTFVTNTAMCRGDTDKDNDRAAECCAPRLLRELAEQPADVPIVALGKSAARAVLGVKSILLARGFVWTARSFEKSIKAAEAGARKARKAAGRYPDKKDKQKIRDADLRVEIVRGRHLLAGRTVLPTIHPAFVLRSDSWTPIFRIDMDRAARVANGKLRLEDLQDNITRVKRARDLVPRTYIVTDDPKEIARAAKKLGPIVSMDIETESTQPLSPLLVKILCVQVSDGDRTFVIGPWNPSLHAGPLSEALRGRQGIIMHNGFNFDQPAVDRDGVHYDPDVVEDTLIAHHTFASHFPQRLDHVVSTFLDASPWKIRHGRRGAEEKGLPPQDMDPDELYHYGAVDAVLTAKAWFSMQGDLAEEMAVYQHDKELSLQGKGLQVGGFRVDRKRKYLLARLLKARAAALKGRMRHICKREDFEPSKLGDVRRVLFTTLRAPMLNPTATGLASTSNATLEALKAGTNRAAKFASGLLSWRVAEKIRSTYVRAVVVHPDGRAHYNWRPYGTVSGRYSCRLQSAPRWSTAVEDRVREMYTADPGDDLWYFDLSQAEARFAANLSGDQNFIDTCKGDVHSGNALILFGPRDDTDQAGKDAAERILRDAKGKNCPKHAGGGGSCNCGKPFRDIAKNAGFAVAYLAEAPAIFAYLRAHGFAVEFDAVVAMLDKLKIAYKTYYRYVEDNIAFCQKHGYLRTAITGRKRVFGYAPKPTEIANFPIQSGIADVMNTRTIILQRQLPSGARLVAQVHDACLFTVPKRHTEWEIKKKGDKVEKIPRGPMADLIERTWAEPVRLQASIVCRQDREFMLPAEIKVGRRWSDFG